jgi:hypothetical protein
MLIHFWDLAALSIPNGNIKGHEPAWIAKECNWPGDPKAFLKALKTAGYIDKDGVITDWQNQPLFRKRISNAEQYQKQIFEKQAHSPLDSESIQELNFPDQQISAPCQKDSDSLRGEEENRQNREKKSTLSRRSGEGSGERRAAPESLFKHFYFSQSDVERLAVDLMIPPRELFPALEALDDKMAPGGHIEPPLGKRIYGNIKSLAIMELKIIAADAQKHTQEEEYESF